MNEIGVIYSDPYGDLTCKSGRNKRVTVVNKKDSLRIQFLLYDASLKDDETTVFNQVRLHTSFTEFLISKQSAKRLRDMLTIILDREEKTCYTTSS